MRLPAPAPSILSAAPAPMQMARDLTRRDLIASGAGAAGLALLGQAGCASDDGQAKPAPRVKKPAPAGAMNVLVVVMDSLRVDHVYGRRARTEALDSLVGDGLRFTRAYPEGMPTIPARRSIMEGHRVYPFRGWHPFKGLTAQPGWEPIGHDRPVWTELPPGARLDHRVRDRQPAHRLLRARQLAQALRPARADLRTGARGAKGHPRRVQGRGLQVPPALDPRHPRRAADGRVPALEPARPARGGVPGLPRLQAGHRLAPMGAHAPAVRAGGGLLRRPRAVGRAALA